MDPIKLNICGPWDLWRRRPDEKMSELRNGKWAKERTLNRTHQRRRKMSFFLFLLLPFLGFLFFFNQLPLCLVPINNPCSYSNAKLETDFWKSNLFFENTEIKVWKTQTHYIMHTILVNKATTTHEFMTHDSWPNC